MSALADLLVQTVAIRTLQDGQSLPRFAQVETDEAGTLAPVDVVDLGLFGAFVRRDREQDARERLPALLHAHPGVLALLRDPNASSYTQLGAYLGDQGLALRLLALGAHLGFWGLLTPRALFGDAVDEATHRRLIGQGYLSTDGKVTL